MSRLGFSRERDAGEKTSMRMPSQRPTNIPSRAVRAVASPDDAHLLLRTSRRSTASG
jgi:hypothetical protein